MEILQAYSNHALLFFEMMEICDTSIFSDLGRQNENQTIIKIHYQLSKSRSGKHFVMHFGNEILKRLRGTLAFSV
jgi:hypothetical protein